MRHLLKLSMVLLACVAVFFVYSFTAQVAPWYIALLSAGSLVSVYLGLAYTPIPQSQRRFAISISALAMLIEMFYGILYVLNVQAPYLFNPPLPLWADIALSVLHGAPFTLLLFSVSMFVFHNQIDTQRLSAEERIVVTLDQQAQLLKQLTDAQAMLAAPQEMPRAMQAAGRSNANGNASMAMAMGENAPGNAPAPTTVRSMTNAARNGTNGNAPVAMAMGENASGYATDDASESEHTCPHCGAIISKGSLAAAHRYGYCKHCKS